ncbi:hypothetical protein G7062_02155 [Erysipelothrix sp. HDW6C]|uniref:hypothetical protein n=1 Tax=Erysipelothrix sp. HDW6C TaxID=2714930 RepID=UPI00140E5C83|nr:hypothetical protein [Erysipelothrix sp. HDW6C]QIK69159.1 hypothetical protein G7062_02155 [Erysipelothrix sp. HDW6C]
MRDYNITKLAEALMKQGRMSPSEATSHAKKLAHEINWETNKKTFHALVKEYLKR